MLRLSELKAAIAITQAVGQRRHGHFDHDAHAATGPFPAETSAPKSAKRPLKAKGVKSVVKARTPRQVRDPVTGQAIMQERR